MKRIVNASAIIMVSWVYFVFGHWAGANKDAPPLPRILWSVTAVSVGVIGLKTIEENEK